MIKIVPYSEKYKGAVTGLILDVWENEFGFRGLERPDIYRISEVYQKDQSGNFWVALNGGGLIGTVGLMRESGDSAHLKRMVIKKEFRKQGLGKRLLDVALAFAKEHGYKTVCAGTVEENSDAIEFYEKHGFKRSKDVPEGITAAQDSICLKLSITNND